MLAVLKTAMEHKNGSLVDVFFSAELSQAISPGLTDLVRECLWVNPLRRASIRELLNHPYFRKIRVSHVVGKKWKLRPTLDFLEALDDSVQRNGKSHDHSLSSRNVLDVDGNISAVNIPNILKVPSRLMANNEDRNTRRKYGSGCRTIDRISQIMWMKSKRRMDSFHVATRRGHIADSQQKDIRKRILPKLSYSLIKYQKFRSPLRRLCWQMILGIDEHIARSTYSSYRRKADYYRANKGNLRILRT